MRDKNRINRILALLQDIWKYQPDVRFNQFVSNLQYLYSEQNDGYGKRAVTIKDGMIEVDTHHLDFFYLEDDEWEGFLKGYLRELSDEREKQLTPSTLHEMVNLFREAGISEKKIPTPLFMESMERYLVTEVKGMDINRVISFVGYLSLEQRRELLEKILKNEGIE